MPLGAEALKDQGGRGRKNTLNNEQEKDFKNTVLDLQEKREGGRIVGRDVKDVLKKDFGTECVNSTGSTSDCVGKFQRFTPLG